VIAAGPDRLELSFEEPQWAATPGQSAVLYDGEVCLGGAIIESTSAASALQKGAVSADSSALI
jgi:tRNA-specific 2-thiouridylase